MNAKNLFSYQHKVDRQKRIGLKGHQPLVIWLTGLSGSGKSTIANLLETRLVNEYSAHTYLLDGDNIRVGLNADLGFSSEDRAENIRRVGEVAKLMWDAGLIVITAFISPFRNDREKVRKLFPEGAFWEVFVSCPLSVCKLRDPKKLYARAQKGEILEFTGISSPYEEPESPDVFIDSEKQDGQACVDIIINRMLEQKIIKASK